MNTLARTRRAVKCWNPPDPADYEPRDWNEEPEPVDPDQPLPF